MMETNLQSKLQRLTCKEKKMMRRRKTPMPWTLTPTFAECENEGERRKEILVLSEGVVPNKSETSKAKNMILQAPDEIDEEG